MDVSLLIAGLGIGIAMAAPLGPVNLIVIRTALRHDLKVAFLAGLGAVLADVLIAGIAAYGIQSISHLILDYAKVLKIAGGIFLIVLGIRTARTHFSASDLTNGAHSARFGLTFSLSVTNPGLVLGYLAIFSSLSTHLALGASPFRPAIVLLGIALGSALWWLALSYFMDRLKARLGPSTLDRINRWSGVLVAAFGFLLLWKAFD
ncbi:MAG: LysE family transporter [Aestuariivirga sp.]|nr:LysE family transporter [Aestuariivirga sp.]